MNQFFTCSPIKKQMGFKAGFLLRNIILFSLSIFLTVTASAQTTSISGATCVAPGTSYQYMVSGTFNSSWSITWCVSGGTINSVHNGCQSGTGYAVYAVTVIWDASPSSHTISLSYPSGNKSLTVTNASTFVAGTISNTSQSIGYNTIPATLSCSAGSGGSCGAYTITYQWQQSADGVSWSNISGATSQNYTSPALTATTYFRRGAVSQTNTTSYSNTASVYVYPQLFSGTPTPATQTINFGVVPASLSVSGVSGGSGSYSYQWQYSTDNVNWNATGTTAITYAAPALYSTTYYRYIVNSSGVVSTSATATINVYPSLVAGALSPSTLSMPYPYNTPTGVITLSGVSGGNGTYTYQWQSSPNNSTWSNLVGATATNYDPGILTTTTYFRVVVTSNGVSSNSAISTISVMPPPLTGGTISPQIYTVASGTSPGPLMANPASGGTCSGSYSYQWQQSSSAITFTDIPGATSESYSPGNLIASTYYRRKVVCGSSTLYTNISTIEVIGAINGDLNYIQERNITKPGVIDFASAQALTDATDVKQVTRYFDGLGRCLQTVSKQASPLLKDLVTTNQYDPLGREISQYIPYVSTSNDGGFKNNPLQDLNTFNSSQFSTEQYFYKQTIIEPSPLNRPLITLPQGNSWVGNNRGLNSQYSVNTANDSVRYWKIAANAGSLPITNSIYAAGTLYKTITLDEQGHQIIEYKDLMGLVVLKKTQLANIPGTAHVGWLSTYFVYDDLNNLRFILQPRCVELINSTWTLTQAIADELCFRYEYDYRRRLLIKKQPGSGEVQMVYDIRDRIIMTQDNNLRNLSSPKWMVTRYDLQNRPDSTGLLSDNNNRSYHQLLADNGNIFYPSTSSNFELLSQVYFDDYTWAAGVGLPGVIDNSNTSNATYFNTGYGNNPTYPLQVVADNINRGKTTGVASKIIGTSNQFIYSVNFYDDHNRQVQSQTINYTGGIDKSTTQFDFNGRILRGLIQHQKAGTNGQTHIVNTKLSYDANGRLLSIYENVDNASTDQLIVSNTYNELGQLYNKSLGANLESLTYDYNIRGWLLGANRDYAKSQSSTTNKFGFDLGYDKSNISTSAGTSIGIFQSPVYNGSIEGTVWKSAGDNVVRKYDFAYDNVSRLTSANFNQNNGSGWDNSYLDFSVGNLSYDANGNIISMNQKGFKVNGSAFIDQLTYTYRNNNQSNQLMQVSDASNDASSKLGDFHYSGTKQSADYSYDANGNMLTDNNKNISGISYNYLNLSQQVAVTGKGTIMYTYDALGTKLKKLVQETGKPDQSTLYVCGFVYQNDTLQFLQHEEGRIRWAQHKYLNGTTGFGFEYDFFLRDHLGNTRMVLTQQKDTVQYVATMEAAYRSTENALFYNIAQSSYPQSAVGGYPADNTTVPNDSLIRVNGNGQKSGPALLLKVMSGDVIDLATKSFYKSGGSNSSQNSTLNDVLNSLALGIVGATSGSHGVVGDFTGSSSPILAALNSFLPTNEPNTGSNKPKAYLNWILLDEQFKGVTTYPQSGAIPVNSADMLNTLAYSGIPITKSGYLYIWVSNETAGWDVYFDNLSVKHYRGAILEETHYYPFGLTMAGISSQASISRAVENKYKFNDGTELGNKEFSDGTGLDLYETNFRSYDPQIGSFRQPDALATLFNNWSPYNFAFDNPVVLNDPTGLAPDNATSESKPYPPDPKPSPVTVKPITPNLPTPDPSKALPKTPSANNVPTTSSNNANSSENTSGGNNSQPSSGGGAGSIAEFASANGATFADIKNILLPSTFNFQRTIDWDVSGSGWKVAAVKGLELTRMAPEWRCFLFKDCLVTYSFDLEIGVPGFINSNTAQLSATAAANVAFTGLMQLPYSAIKELIRDDQFKVVFKAAMLLELKTILNKKVTVSTILSGTVTPTIPVYTPRKP